MKLSAALCFWLALGCTNAFLTSDTKTEATRPTASSPQTITNLSVTKADDKSVAESVEELRRQQKEFLLGLLGRPTGLSNDGGRGGQLFDPVLADPETKEPIRIHLLSPILGGEKNSATKVTMRSSSDSAVVYTGRTDTYLNLLEADISTSEAGAESSDDRSPNQFLKNALNSLQVFIPPPLRPVLAGSDYVPMRDLFTSPAVSFAYERGWRQGFARAGFPGPDKEYELVKEFFEPAVVGAGKTTVVDMSCATGLFTRRLAKSNDYDRVIACDYSESMLLEARRRIRSDVELRSSHRTQLDLVRCDVGKIPMQTESVNALHAGAAMHCWPDLKSALSEIYRVLKPGGRYFATTFLLEYFQALQVSEGGSTGPTMQAYQYFGSAEQLKEMMLDAGFDEEKVKVEVLGRACVVIRCEK